MKIKLSPRVFITATLVCVAIILLVWKYNAYLRDPWTRDAKVNADVIQIAARVSAPIIELPLVDNQAVQKGQLLFALDPRTFEAELALAQARYRQAEKQIKAMKFAVDAAKANVSQVEAQITEAQEAVVSSEANLVEAEKNLVRYQDLQRKGSISIEQLNTEQRNYAVDLASHNQTKAELLDKENALINAKASLAQKEAELGLEDENNATLQAAKAAVTQAKLNLSFTKVYAPTDGYITNLQLRVGSQITAEQPVLALIDQQSYRIEAYFRETLLSHIKVGDTVQVKLMSYPDQLLQGQIKSIGWGIAVSNNDVGEDLLPTVSPTYQWIRLAQRLPVEIAIEPTQLPLRLGMTASVWVHGD